MDDDAPTPHSRLHTKNVALEIALGAVFVLTMAAGFAYFEHVLFIEKDPAEFSVVSILLNALMLSVVLFVFLATPTIRLRDPPGTPPKR